MKRAIIALGLFFVIQLLAAIGAVVYVKDLTATTDAFIIATGIGLLIGNIILSLFLARRVNKTEWKPTASLWSGVAAMLLIALSETFLLAPLDIEDATTEHIMTVMAASPWCLLGLCVAGPVAEELVFRWGILGGLLKQGTNPWLAVAVSAVTFAVVHGNWLQAPAALLSGALLGIIYIRSKSIVLCIVAHICNNTLAVAALHIPEAEEKLTNQPTALLLLEGTLLAALSFAVAIKCIKPYEDRTH